MRGGNEGADRNSRFSVDYEAKSIYEGIAEDLGGTVGVEIDWFRWQDYHLRENVDTIVDDIYDVSSSTAGEGRRWMLPFKMPVVLAQLIRGGSPFNERGFYTTDTLRVVINSGDVSRLHPGMVGNEPNQYIKDRIVYRGQVFSPRLVNPRGAFGYQWAVVTVDCVEVNPEELVNDPQFQAFAKPSISDIRTLGYSYGRYGSDLYGE